MEKFKNNELKIWLSKFKIQFKMFNKWKFVQIMTHFVKPIFLLIFWAKIGMSEMSYFWPFTMHYINSHNFVSYEDI